MSEVEIRVRQTLQADMHLPPEERRPIASADVQSILGELDSSRAAHANAASEVGRLVEQRQTLQTGLDGAKVELEQLRDKLANVLAGEHARLVRQAQEQAAAEGELVKPALTVERSGGGGA